MLMPGEGQLKYSCTHRRLPDAFRDGHGRHGSEDTDYLSKQNSKRISKEERSSRVARALRWWLLHGLGLSGMAVAIPSVSMSVYILGESAKNRRHEMKLV